MLLWLIPLIVVCIFVYIFIGGMAAGDFEKNYYEDGHYNDASNEMGQTLVQMFWPIYMLVVIRRTGKRLVNK